MSEILKLEETFYLSTVYDFNFIVLGIGGTGSELAPKLCRALSFKKNIVGGPAHEIILVDGDIVEEKNIMRQNFFSSDLQKNKAEVMALKCATAFGINVKAYPKYLENSEELDSLINGSSMRIPFIIGCVDTNAVRKMLHEYMKRWHSSKPLFWVDSGNEEFAGQVVLGVKKPNGSFMSQHQVTTVGEGQDAITYTTYNFNLPTVADLYPDILTSEEKFTTALSCAERAVSNPQAADTNVEAANVIYQMVSNCLRGRIDYHHVTFNVLKGNRRTEYNTRDMLEKYKVNFSYYDEAKSRETVHPVITPEFVRAGVATTNDIRVVAAEDLQPGIIDPFDRSR